MNMNKYIKKPVVIEAVQLTKDNFIDVIEWANSIQPAGKKVLLSYKIPSLEALNNGEKKSFQGLEIPTKEGKMLCAFGDYLIKEPFPTDDRMFYPCKPDMFELTYQSI